MNPNTRTCPIFRSRRDAELTKAIYRRVPVLIREGEDDTPEANSWGIHLQRMFHMADDSNLFCTREQLEADGCTLEGNIFRKENAAYLPLYEAKMLHQYDNRYNTYDGVPLESRFNVKAFALPMDDKKRDPYAVPLPRYWVAEAEVISAWPHTSNWCFVFRDVTNVNTNRRTAIFSILPRTAVGNKAPTLFPRSARGVGAAGLYGDLCSFVFDYCVRQSVGGSSLSFFILRQLPVLQETDLHRKCEWAKSAEILGWLAMRVLELTYTSWDLEPFALDCGWCDPPFRWDEERRFLLRCELDAAFFHLYLSAETNGDWRHVEGETAEHLAQLKASFPTPRDAVAYIMDTFPIVRRKDEEKYNGDYRTKRVILEIYDAIARSIRTGEPYQTRLEPPPADARCCHPPRVDRKPNQEALEAGK